MGLLSVALACVPDHDAFSDDYIRSGWIVPVLQTLKYGYSFRILVYDGFVAYAHDYVPVLYCQSDFKSESLLCQ